MRTSWQYRQRALELERLDGDDRQLTLTWRRNADGVDHEEVPLIFDSTGVVESFDTWRSRQGRVVAILYPPDSLRRAAVFNFGSSALFVGEND